MAEPVSMYERVGGDDYFHALVARFYVRVATDKVLRPLYPEDVGPGAFNLAEFLIQYWGGPARYNQRQGHPRLRMRHIPFRIGQAEREAWLHHMTVAVQESNASPEDAQEMIAYFEMATTSLVNHFGD